MGVSLGIDASKLDRRTGARTAADVVRAQVPRERVEEFERRAARRRRTLEQSALLEDARASEARRWDDGAGAVWDYVPLEDGSACIVGCAFEGTRLRVPESVEGVVVSALGPEACAGLPSVVELECPPALAAIGLCAFRGCSRLERVTLPAGMDAYDPSWLRGCDRVEELALPGCLEVVPSSVLDLPRLRSLSLGAGTKGIEPGAFGRSRLASIAVDAANPWLKGDGRALYSKDGAVLVALAVPGCSYRVLDGCRMLARKALSGFESLEEVQLPEGLGLVGEYAFSRTSIRRFEAPAALERIMERAFFDCAALEEASLGTSLRFVGAHAFTGTAIRELRLPASLEDLGTPVADRVALAYSGPSATFSIDPACPCLRLDAQGALYRRQPDGEHLVRLMDRRASSCEVAEGTVAIDDDAFSGCAGLIEARLPASLRWVGHRAFKGCGRLARVSMREGVRFIGDEAFLGTSLEQLQIPSTLECLGERALVTHGALHGEEPPTLRDVTVAEGNPRFSMESGLLLERLEDGRIQVVHFTDAVEEVQVPSEVSAIAPYAFNGARHVRSLRLSDRIVEVGIRGLAVDCLIERIRLDLAAPIEGHASFELCFPATDRGKQQMRLALSVPPQVSVEALFEHYDNAIMNGSSFDAETEAGLDLCEQAQRIIERLREPVLMREVNRSLGEGFLRANAVEACLALARQGDREGITALVDLGLLGEEGLLRAVERVGALQDATMTGHLLELQRQRFGAGGLDFEL